jgi:GAF domain-containing protein
MRTVEAEVTLEPGSLAEIVFTDATLGSILDLVIRIASASLHGIDGIGLSLATNGEVETVSYSSEMVREIDRVQCAVGEGPCLAALEDDREHVSFLTQDSRWPEFSDAALRHGIRAVVGYPLRVQGQAIGVFNLYSAREDFFTDEVLEVAALLARQAAAVLTNARAYTSAAGENEQLGEALLNRDTIGMAKGIMMERERCSAAEAFRRLTVISQASNTKLRDVARGIVAELEAGIGTED